MLQLLHTLRNKNGSVMIEAAIVYPLMIGAVMVLIYIMLNIYSAASLQSHLHIMLREESGKKSQVTRIDINDAFKRDKIRAKAEQTSISIKLVPRFGYDSVEALKTRNYSGNGMIRKSVKKQEYGSYYVINEVDLLKKKSLIS